MMMMMVMTNELCFDAAQASNKVRMCFDAAQASNKVRNLPKAPRSEFLLTTSGPSRPGCKIAVGGAGGSE